MANAELVDALADGPTAAKLNGWERRFVASVAEQLAQRGTLSDRQREVLERVYAERADRGDAAAPGDAAGFEEPDGPRREPDDTAPPVHAVHRPWPHQLRGLGLVRQFPATYLAWEMGAGKTKPIVDYVAEQRLRAVLVVCPKAVVRVWAREFDKHVLPDRRRELRVEELGAGRVADRAEILDEALGEADRDATLVAIVNYEATIHEPLRSLLAGTRWGLVVYDEAHRIKSPGGKQSRAAHAIGRRADRRVALSGTPIPHSPLDLFGQLRFLDPRLLGSSFTRFKGRYAVMGGARVNGRPVEVVGWRNLPELRRTFYSVADRVRTDDVLDLPGTHHIERPVRLGRRAAKLYNELERDLVVAIGDGVVTASNALTLLIRLAQVASGYAVGEVDGDDGLTRRVVERVDDGKADAFAEIVEDLPPGEPVVVASRFLADLDRAEEVATKLGRPVDHLRGGRDDVGGVWEPRPGAVLATQVKAGREGLDLTAARHCVLWSVDFNHGDYCQLLKRLDRPGQRRVVVYHHLLAEGTVDERVRETYRRREAMQAGILDPSAVDAVADLVADYRKGVADG